VKSNGTPSVTITLPDGETEQFQAKWFPECRLYLAPTYGEIKFVPLNGKTHSKLEQLTYGTLRVTNLPDGSSNIIDPGEGLPADPSLYQLTTEEGMVYLLDQSFGIRKITDQAGNTITYSDDGIVHSSGTRVDFVRDSEKRITDIVLPDGRRLKYAYDLKGDLQTVKDQLNYATTFGYLANIRYPHYLKDITDARGIKAIRHEYDDDGRLVKSIDADGNPIEYTHNIAGKTEIIKNRRGFATTYIYDDNGWVLLERNALGEEKTWTYDQNGNVLSQTDALGRKTAFVVDVRGNILEEKDPLGNVTKRTWGQYNQLYTETDPLGRVVMTNKYKRNLAGEDTSFLVETKSALGETTTFGLDLCNADPASCGGSGNIKQIVDPVLASTSFGYDRKGNLISMFDALGNKTTNSYDTVGRLTTEVRTRVVNGQTQSLTTEQLYDAKGQVIESKAPDGGIIRTVYNSFGKPEQIIDALGRITRMEYDVRGMDKKTIYPDLSFEETIYDGEGNIIAKRDRLGRVTKMVYDAANRLIETILPDLTPAIDTDNPRLTTKFDAAGQVEWKQDERGNKSFVKYDLAGRSIESKDALGNAMTTVYDAAGQRTSITDALGRTTKYVYDNSGRLRETIFPDETPATDVDNPRMLTEYDAVGRKIVQNDEMGRITRYSFDKLGRLLTVVLPNPSTGMNPPLVDGVSPANSGALVTSYEYDEQGNRTTQIDAEGHRTSWTYDAVGRNLTRKLPLGQTEFMVYNAAGERTQHTNFNGVDTLFAYDRQGRMDKVTFPNNRARQFTYTTDGKVQSINDAGQVYSFEYDERDRLSKATDSYGRDIQYQYDAIGNRTQLKTTKQEINYSFDSLNRLSAVVTTTNAASIGWAANQKASYQYDAVGSRQSMINPNGTLVSYGYDVRNRLKTLVHKASTASNAAVLLSLSYTVDASGLRTQIAETRPESPSATTRTSNYTYDKVKRLTREDISGTGSQNRASQWTYDRVGNRLSEVTTGTINKNIRYVYDANDRLNKETDSSGNTLVDYSYDQNGNTIQKKLGTNILASYRWDEENRMIGATIGSKVISYAYDPNGMRRSQEEVDGSTKKRTEYLVDANQSYAQVVEEWDANGAASNALPDEVLGKTYVFGDDLISQTKIALNGAGTNSFYHYDGLGTTRALSDALGTITDRIAYTAFGENDPAGTSGNTSGSTDNSFKYTGEQFDPNLGFYYLRARYMNPSAGGFFSMDSYGGALASPISLNKYTYANAMPTMGGDPSGLIFSFLGIADIGFSLNGGAIIRTSSINSAKGQFQRILFGRPPQDLGIVGEFILDSAINAVLGNIGVDFTDKQHAGTRAHKDLEIQLGSYKPIGGIEVIPEIFFDDQGAEGTTRDKGTLGIDILIKYRGKNALLIDLKLGAGFPNGKRREIGTRAGNLPVVQIFIGLRIK
jgi:RHS repeat-associated protein